MNFSSIIIKRRKELHLTKMELAEQLNVTDKTVSRWKTGNQNPDSSILPDLARVLKISIQELYGEEELNREFNEMIKLIMTRLIGISC